MSSEIFEEDETLKVEDEKEKALFCFEKLSVKDSWVSLLTQVIFLYFLQFFYKNSNFF